MFHIWKFKCRQKVVICKTKLYISYLQLINGFSEIRLVVKNDIYEN